MLATSFRRSGTSSAQNQFGGAMGGPIKKNAVFFFGDYQGTRSTQGISSGLISVPSLADRAGNLSDQASSLTGTVSGPYLADLLSEQAGLRRYRRRAILFSWLYDHRAVRFPERRDSDAGMVGARPASPAVHSGTKQWSVHVFDEAPRAKFVRDDKASFRIDANTQRMGITDSLLFHRRLHRQQSLSDGPGRRQRARFQCPQQRPGPAHYSWPYQDFRPDGGKRNSSQLHAQREHGGPARKAALVPLWRRKVSRRALEPPALYLCCLKSKAWKT